MFSSFYFCVYKSNFCLLPVLFCSICPVFLFLLCHTWSCFVISTPPHVVKQFCSSWVFTFFFLIWVCFYFFILFFSATNRFLSVIRFFLLPGSGCLGHLPCYCKVTIIYTSLCCLDYLFIFIYFTRIKILKISLFIHSVHFTLNEPKDSFIKCKRL